MEGNGRVEADPNVGLDDDDSFIEQQLLSLTRSLTSSVLNYPIENGRQYHAFRSGSYLLPNDDAELDRLDLSHHIMTKSLGNKLYLAPIDEHRIHRVLDIGTGTGIWAIELGDKLPNAEILGNDLSPIQSHWVPSNVRFEVDDVESPWVYDFKFDFIFSRYMAACIHDWPNFVQRAYEYLKYIPIDHGGLRGLIKHSNLAPNGWVEFQDFDLEYKCDDGTFNEDHHLKKWMNALMDASRRIGRDPAPGPSLEEWVRDAGFKDLRAQRLKIPIGTWPKDLDLKEIGLCNLVQVLEGLEGFTLRLFCDVLGWKRAEIMVLLSLVRKELKSGKLHCYLNFYIACGRKP